MKIYGYSLDNLDDLKEMSEISLQTTSKNLREIATFLISSADKIDINDPDSPDHFHFQDYSKNWNDTLPDIIVANGEIKD